ncbi:hypothetical protein NEFER03_0201 [Nematocida sp. LUAm3]|nr:hypothetical protein NEFER03_0201 [Nematocida sp. LUAm3]KAI5173654.1 hypothetical protein NEFER02_0170 [Nematocida sp. LUAm2]KAI5176875.1 hypothetical protein NEFER01_0200 [Nematocida sp. LUAm1]
MQYGDRVVVDKVYLGTIRYIGRVPTKKGTVIGVELDTKSGDTNGKYGLTKYFTCAPGYGTFRSIQEIQLYKPEEYNQTGLLCAVSEAHNDTRNGTRNTLRNETCNGTRNGTRDGTCNEMRDGTRKREEELLNENVEIQRAAERLAKENNELRRALHKEQAANEELRQLLRNGTQHMPYDVTRNVTRDGTSNVTRDVTRNVTRNEVRNSNRTAKDVVIDLFKELKVKIEKESRIFST